MPINWIDNKGNQIDPPRNTTYDKAVRISEYKEVTGHTWKSGVWMKWWNWNKDREDIIKARRERDRRYNQLHREERRSKRVAQYHIEHPNSQYYRNKRNV